MAFYYIVKALDLPPGSEIIFPALTFWVIPEMARVAGLKPVFADIDPVTFNITSETLARAITPATRAVVPTHLYGLACDMDPIVALARDNNLRIIEDCAHALGATYRDRPVGTFGDAAFFSFQTLKPLNTYGGGMALVRDPQLARTVAALAAAEPWPHEKSVRARLRRGRAERIFTRPDVFTWTGFPILWAASWLHARPDVYLWESIRPLDRFPPGYSERYTNVQAAMGLENLIYLERWTQATQAYARVLDSALEGLAGVRVPYVPPGQTHVFYQYCVYVPDRDVFVRRCIRRGLDVETLHVDVCTQISIFGHDLPKTPGAERAAAVVQIPVCAGLTDRQIDEIAKTARKVLSNSTAPAIG
jgi:dTDP-4-amino-4,6-dideoxygalactose transaminase